MPADLPSVVPNVDGWFNCVAGVLEATALPNRFAAGGATDEVFAGPKLNIGFDSESDPTGAGAAGAGGLDGVALVGLLVIPKLNFGFIASAVPPAGRALAVGLALLLVDVGGLEGCENEKKL